MNKMTGTKFLAVLFVAALGSTPIAARAQDKPANNLESAHEKLKADKKVIVSKYMELTESEAKNVLDDWLALEQDDMKQRNAFIPKVTKALPAKKAARYLQIENEYRMLLR